MTRVLHITSSRHNIIDHEESLLVVNSIHIRFGLYFAIVSKEMDMENLRYLFLLPSRLARKPDTLIHNPTNRHILQPLSASSLLWWAASFSKHRGK